MKDINNNCAIKFGSKKEFLTKKQNEYKEKSLTKAFNY